MHLHAPYWMIGQCLTKTVSHCNLDQLVPARQRKGMWDTSVNVTTVAWPCTPERTQHHQLTTWPFWQLEASMIITCNYIFQIYNICHIYLHVHKSTVYLYSSSFTVKRKTLKKLWNDEDWRTMPNPYALVSTEPPRLQDLFYQVWDDRIVAEFQLFECWELCRSPYKPRLHRRCLTSALSWNEMRPPLQWKGFQP